MNYFAQLIQFMFLHLAVGDILKITKDLVLNWHPRYWDGLI